MGGNWLVQSFVALLLLTPTWLAIAFFGKNFGVSGGTFLVWYFLGSAVTVALFGVRPLDTLIPSWGIVAAIFAVGLTLGGLANLAIFNAVNDAPNPGLPVAITNAAGMTTFLGAIVLAYIAPKYFQAPQFDVRSFIGIVLVLAGTGLIAVR